MNSKIINVVLICLFSLCIAGKANAGLIVGDLYEDQYEPGLYWEYVGSFELADVVPGYINTTNNGIEAALLHFNTLSADQIALSTRRQSEFIDITNFLVNHQAYYDTFEGGELDIDGVVEKAEDISTDLNGNSAYDFTGDVSAMVKDRASTIAELQSELGFTRDEIPEDLLYINYVFKSVTTSVPEPSTLVIFMLALVGLTTRHFKNK
jgi:hypothetical protein